MLLEEEKRNIVQQYVQGRSANTDEMQNRMNNLHSRLKNGDQFTAKEFIYALNEGFLKHYHQQLIDKLLNRFGFPPPSPFNPPMPLPTQMGLSFVWLIGTIFEQIPTARIDNAIVDSYETYMAVLPALIELGYAKTPYDVDEIYAIIEYISCEY